MKAAIIAGVLCLLAPLTQAEVWPDFAAARNADYPNPAVREINLGRGHTVDVYLEITKKGNGTLGLPGLGVRVYDAHNDGMVFKDSLLKCEWLDLDGDGIAELQVSGFAVISDEKGKQTAVHAVQAVFRYSEHRFKVVTCSPEISYWKVI